MTELFAARRVGSTGTAPAGAAMSSVSRVLSGHPDVSPKMRQPTALPERLSER